MNLISLHSFNKITRTPQTVKNHRHVRVFSRTIDNRNVNYNQNSTEYNLEKSFIFYLKLKVNREN